MAEIDKYYKKRVIAVISGSRAEYGILYHVIRAIHEDDSFKLRLLVTGAHLLRRFGRTIRCIIADGFPIAAKIYGATEDDSRYGAAAAMGRITCGFAEAYERFKPDLIVALGDRYEIFAAVAAAVPFTIPVAHIHGGEVTRGSFDEQFRHAITKMSHIHFVATEKYRRRVIQMGEEPWRVRCVGAPGIDNIRHLQLLGREDLARVLGIPDNGPLGVVTYHPVTLERNTSARHISELLWALERFPDIHWVMTLPNNDPGHSIIARQMRAFARRNNNRTSIFTSLGQSNYLSILKNAAVMVGNSSSGIIEAPSFGLPVVNIGDRQTGRVRGKNVIDVRHPSRASIAKGLSRALEARFRKGLRGVPNPYGSGTASRKIVKALKTIPLDERLIKKTFKEIL